MCKETDWKDEYRKAIAAGIRVQFREEGRFWINPELELSFVCDERDYRIHPDDVQKWERIKNGNKGTPHPHAELIKAWADGAKIQEWSNDWYDQPDPCWYTDVKYRIKPAELTDVEKYGVEVGDVWSTGRGEYFLKSYSGTESFRSLYGDLISKRSLLQLRFRRGVINKL